MVRRLGVLLIIIGAFMPAVGFLSPTFYFSSHYSLPIIIIVMLSLVTIGTILQFAFRENLSEKRMEIIDKQFPCPVCKKSEFKWGNVPAARIHLRVGVGQSTWARVCTYCGNVQQFTKPE